MASSSNVHSWPRNSKLRDSALALLHGTAILAIANRDGLLVVGDKFSLCKEGGSDALEKIAIADKHLLLGLWGVGGLQDPNGQTEMVLLRFVVDYFSANAFTGTTKQFSELEKAWGEWFIAWCELHKFYPPPTDGGIWAQMLLASNHQPQMCTWLLDFMYSRTKDNISLAVQSFPLPSANLQTTAPWIYGCFGRQLPLAIELGAKFQAGRATDEEKALLALLTGRLDRKALPSDKAVGLAKLIVRDFHLNDRDPQGLLHVGSSIDAILLPWQGDASLKAVAETVL